MTIRRIEIKASQLDRLRADLRAIPDAPPGPCLQDEEFVDYTLGRLSPAEIERFDAHLAACEQCAATLEHMLTEYERGRQEAPAPAPGPLDLLRNTFAGLVESWRAFLAQPLPLAATATTEEGQVVWEWASPDGSARAHVVLEANGDLTFRCSSTRLELAGRFVAVVIGPKRFETRLERVSETEVGARIAVPRADRPEELGEIRIRFG